MPLSADEEKLLEHALAALPSWFTDLERPMEDLAAAAKIMGSALTLVRHWLADQTRILAAVGATADEPDWLNEHARDRATHRQEDEGDATLRERLRQFPDAVTLPVLRAAAQAVVDAAGIVGEVAVLSLRADQIYLGTFEPQEGTGGEFGSSPDGALFTPDAGWASPPRGELELSDAADPGNDGTFEIEALVGDAARYDNAGVVTGADAGVSWTARKVHPVGGEVVDGFARSYLSRGYRIGHSGRPHVVIAILPYGCDAAVEASVRESLRQRVAAGVVTRIECRANP